MLAAQNVALAARVAELEAANSELSERMARLERAASRNSGNSSPPPSLDDQPRRTPPPGEAGAIHGSSRSVSRLTRLLGRLRDPGHHHVQDRNPGPGPAGRCNSGWAAPAPGLLHRRLDAAWPTLGCGLRCGARRMTRIAPGGGRCSGPVTGTPAVWVFGTGAIPRTPVGEPARDRICGSPASERPEGTSRSVTKTTAHLTREPPFGMDCCRITLRPLAVHNGCSVTAVR